VVLTKSTKPVPVMLVGVLLYGLTYPWYKYVSVAMLCGGICLFSFAKAAGKGKGGGDVSAMSQLIGLFLVGVNLFLDGYTNNAQDHIFKTHKASSIQMMKYVNLWQFIYLVVFLLVGYTVWGSESELAAAYTLFSGSAELRFDILMFCLCASTGQLFIFTVIQEFGSLLWVTISITRKLVTIFVSVVMFNHSISPGQWGGVALVFGGMALEVVMSRAAKSKKADKEGTKEKSVKDKKTK
jgi:solute carrier family 35 (UDP-galactose transporter), member B1